MPQPDNLHTQPGRSGWQAVATSPWAMAVAIAALMAAVISTSAQRTFLGGAETDFSVLYSQEALRILRGEPLLLPYHPPAYAFLLALGRLLVDSRWLTLGVWISGISAFVVLVASAYTWRRLAATAGAWGALLALACSSAFRVSASVASSDMLFTALVCVLLALVVSVLQSPRRAGLWAACGALAALVFLTRTNGVFAAAVLALPFLVPSADANRLRNLATVAAAFLLPMLAWVLYAGDSGSPLMPVNNHRNVAVAVFGDGVGKWGEQMQRLEPLMRNMTEVLLYDPPRLVARIAANLAILPYDLVRRLTWLPFGLLAIPGLALMLWKRRTPALLVILAILTCMALVTGILEYVGRFYLMLIPMIGAMAGVAFASILERLPVRPSARAVIASAAVAVAALVAAWTHAHVLPKIESGLQVEYIEAAAAFERLTEPEAGIFSRSYGAVLESGRTVNYLPDFDSLDALRTALCPVAASPPPAYLYIGQREREFRVRLTTALDAHTPDWLELVARGTKTGWTLYRIRLDQSNAASCSSSSAT